MRKKRLLWHFFFAYFSISVAVMLLVGLFAAHTARDLYLQNVRAELENDARLIDHVLAAAPNMPPEKLQERCRALAGTLNKRITLIGRDGKVLADSEETPEQMDNHGDRPEVAEALAGTVGRISRYSNTLHQDLQYLALPASQSGQGLAVVRLAVAVHSLADTLHAVYWHITAVLAAVTLLSGMASYWAARRILRPLEQIRAGAARLAAGELQHRLPDADAEEISALAVALNQMAQQLDQRIRTILRQQREHEVVLASMEEGVLAVDTRAVVLNVNEAFCRLLGVGAGQVRGRLLHEVVRKPDLLRFIETALASDSPIHDDLQFLGLEDRCFNAHGTVLHNAEHRNIGALIVLHDVTELRRLENVRRDFVANVSHELRTPITSIKGFVETLLDEGPADSQNTLRFLRIIQRQVNRLDSLIEDLLSLSRIERGSEDHAIALEPKPVVDVLRAALELCGQKATEKQVRLEMECPAELRATMNATLLEQAVSNLVDNAIKHSEVGTCVRITGRADADGTLIVVQDEGCGIAPKHLPRLFERFYRVDKARSRESGGTGLGLAIVKHIVAAHRGTVRVESTVGKGSTFFIHLPAIE
jgi:two-component system phosphate regulon sensor histidine kinase PhoR